MNILALIIPFIPQIMAGVKDGIQLIANIRKTAKQTDEWPQEAEAAFLQGLIDAYDLPQWKTDFEKAAKPPGLI